MKYIVKMKELKEQGEELEKYATDVLDTKIEGLINLIDEFKWTGPVYEEYSKIYKERTSKLRDISKMIKAYSKFMISSSSEFTNVSNEVNKMNDLLTDINNKEGKNV